MEISKEFVVYLVIEFVLFFLLFNFVVELVYYEWFELDVSIWYVFIIVLLLMYCKDIDKLFFLFFVILVFYIYFVYFIGVKFILVYLFVECNYYFVYCDV